MGPSTIVVPSRDTELPGQQLPLDFAGRDAVELTHPLESNAPRRIGWACLLARVFALDVTVYRKCGGRMRILEVVDTPDVVARVLHGAPAPSTARTAPAPPLTRTPRRRARCLSGDAVFECCPPGGSPGQAALRACTAS